MSQPDFYKIKSWIYINRSMIKNIYSIFLYVFNEKYNFELMNSKQLYLDFAIYLYYNLEDKYEYLIVDKVQHNKHIKYDNSNENSENDDYENINNENNNINYNNINYKNNDESDSEEYEFLDTFFNDYYNNKEYDDIFEEFYNNDESLYNFSG